MNRFEQVLENNNLEFIETELIGGKFYNIYSNEYLTIFASQDFKVIRLDKPNRTHKWYYEKTFAQLNALIKQTLSFYRF